MVRRACARSMAARLNHEQCPCNGQNIVAIAHLSPIHKLMGRNGFQPQLHEC